MEIFKQIRVKTQESNVYMDQKKCFSYHSMYKKIKNM